MAVASIPTVGNEIFKIFIAYEEKRGIEFRYSTMRKLGVRRVLKDGAL